MPVGVLVLSGGYVLLAAVAAIIQGNREFVMYIAVMLVLMGVVTALHRRVCFSQGLLWCLSIWGLAHMVGGLAPVPRSWPINGDIRVFYSLWIVPGYLKFDQVVHAYGFLAATWACWQAFRLINPAGPRRTFGPILLAVCAGVGLGAMNEVVEFAAVLLIPHTNVGGYVNTGWDLVANLVGSALGGVLIRLGFLQAGS